MNPDIINAAVQKLEEYEIVTLTYFKDDGSTFKKPFTITGIEEKFYNKKTKTFTLMCFCSGIKHTIHSSRICQVEYPSTNEFQAEYVIKAIRQKTAYLNFLKDCPSDYCLDECFFDPMLTDWYNVNLMMGLRIPNITEYNNPSAQTIQNCKTNFTKLIEERIETEKQNIKDEFKSINGETETSAEELNAILDYLTDIVPSVNEDMLNANTYDEIIALWPFLLNPLPLYFQKIARPL